MPVTERRNPCLIHAIRPLISNSWARSPSVHLPDGHDARAVTLRRADRAPAPAPWSTSSGRPWRGAGEETALDNGADVLTYEEFAEAAEAVADELAALGVGPRRQGRRPAAVGHDRPLHRDHGGPAGRRGVRPGRRRRPRRAGPAGLRRGRRRRRHRRGPGLVEPRRTAPPRDREDPTADDDAWVIFTSGSTGTPKGVAVTHRNAAAFVDAESRLFLQDAPLGPGDRVMAGLSVAFDASPARRCGWPGGTARAWCPAPRALVRSGMDVGPWLVANEITVVSTVPTLVALWPDDALDRVRLLILGGEAVPARARRPGWCATGREVWNTYGPTEATVVACGARLTGGRAGPDRAAARRLGPRRRRRRRATRCRSGEPGELIIGGVGLARYLDPEKDAEKYAADADPRLGPRLPQRRPGGARPRGPAVRRPRRRPGQARRAPDRARRDRQRPARACPAWSGAAAAVRRTAAGNQLLVGYVDRRRAVRRRRASMARAARRAAGARWCRGWRRSTTIPTRTSGKVDRDALPWPLPGATAPGRRRGLDGTAAWVAGAVAARCSGATVARAATTTSSTSAAAA